MTYKLYNRDGSGGFVVEAALTLVEAPFELVRLDSRPGNPLPESFREINPWGQVPVLILPRRHFHDRDGGDLDPSRRLSPREKLAPPPGTSAHGVFMRWMVFLATNIYEAEIRVGYPERFTTDPASAPAISEAATARMTAGLRLIEDNLEPGAFLLGEAMTLVDVYLAMLLAWHGAGHGLPLCESLTHRVAAHPTVAPIWQRNFDHRLSTDWGRT